MSSPANIQITITCSSQHTTRVAGGCHTARTLSLLSDCPNRNSPSALGQEGALPADEACRNNAQPDPGYPKPTGSGRVAQEILTLRQLQGSVGSSWAWAVTQTFWAALQGNVWVCTSTLHCLQDSLLPSSHAPFIHPPGPGRKPQHTGQQGWTHLITTTRQIHHREQAWILHLLEKKNISCRNTEQLNSLNL